MVSVWRLAITFQMFLSWHAHSVLMKLVCSYTTSVVGLYQGGIGEQHNSRVSAVYGCEFCMGIHWDSFQFPGVCHSIFDAAMGIGCPLGGSAKAKLKILRDPTAPVLSVPHRPPVIILQFTFDPLRAWSVAFFLQCCLGGVRMIWIWLFVVLGCVHPCMFPILCSVDFYLAEE